MTSSNTIQSLKSLAPAAIVAGAHYFVPSIISKSMVAAVVVIQVVTFLHTLALSPYTAPPSKKVLDEDEDEEEEGNVQSDMGRSSSVPDLLLYAFGAVGVILLARMLKMFGMVEVSWWAPFMLGGVVRVVMFFVRQTHDKEDQAEISADDEGTEHLNEEWRELEFWQELDQEDQGTAATTEAKDIANAALVATSVKLGGSTLLHSKLLKKPLVLPTEKFADDNAEQTSFTHHSKPHDLFLYIGGAMVVLLLGRVLKVFGIVQVTWWAPFLLGGIVRAVMLSWQASVVKSASDLNTMESMDDQVDELTEEWQEFEFWRELDEGCAANNAKEDAKDIAKSALAATCAMLSH